MISLIPLWALIMAAYYFGYRNGKIVGRIDEKRSRENNAKLEDINLYESTNR